MLNDCKCLDGIFMDAIYVNFYKKIVVNIPNALMLLDIRTKVEGSRYNFITEIMGICNFNSIIRKNFTVYPKPEIKDDLYCYDCEKLFLTVDQFYDLQLIVPKGHDPTYKYVQKLMEFKNAK